MLAHQRAITRQPGSSTLRLIGAIGLATYLGCAFTPLPVLLSRWLSLSPALAPADAIVVLGAGGVRDNGELTDTSLRRTLHGITLYQRGLAPLLALSGGPSPNEHVEGEVRARLARQLHVEPDAIVVDSAARTTREEAVRFAALLAPRGVRRILLVGDAQGTRRAAGVFTRAGFQVLPAPAEDVSGSGGGPEDRLDLMRRVSLEALALVYYRLAGYI
jgi:uncharacterized SAM-binding protein YcdF (DUF218 family)